MRKLLMAASAATALFAAAPALADITVVSAAPYPGNPPENVLLTSGSTGNLILGTTNQTNTTVRISSATDSLVASPNGQAMVTSTTAGGIQDLNISLNSGMGFTSFEFNVNSAVDGTIGLIFTDQFGTTQAQNVAVSAFPTSFTVGANGVNRFNAFSTNGQIITNVRLTGTNIADVRQIRLGGVTAVVPEPGTWALMIAGFGGAGAMLRRRRSALAAI